ncbi:hypothetical protein RUM43_005586 [Polyplax serrata]|uniref:Uncharacterized protein n=1 Tax=Polyplax serrata TaxID=468196 RepID=A0AAN8NQG4_POLSC
MASSEYVQNKRVNIQSMNELLPHVVGIVERLEGATFGDIHRELEKDLDADISPKHIALALENGMQLGVIKIQREYKVCREFTTRELKKVKHVGDHLIYAGKKIDPMPIGMNKRQKSIMEYVKRERRERRKKMQKKKKSHANIELAKEEDEMEEVDDMDDLDDGDEGDDDKLSRYLCRRCKKSLEKELMSAEASCPSCSTDEAGSEPAEPSAHSIGSDESWESKSSKKGEGEEKKPPKSRLLVEKNPLETEPPYYDIFT